MRKRYDQKCLSCSWAAETWAEPHENPSCPDCGAATDRDWGASRQAHGVKQDSIEGGVWIRHGICNPDGSPRKYYSHTEMKMEAAKRGLINLVEHVPLKGSDKSPHTTKWTATDTTNYDDAGVRAARRAEMAAFLGVTSERYAEITAPSRDSNVTFGPTSTARIVAESVAAYR